MGIAASIAARAKTAVVLCALLLQVAVGGCLACCDLNLNSPAMSSCCPHSGDCGHPSAPARSDCRAAHVSGAVAEIQESTLALKPSFQPAVLSVRPPVSVSVASRRLLAAVSIETPPPEDRAAIAVLRI